MRSSDAVFSMSELGDQRKAVGLSRLPAFRQVLVLHSLFIPVVRLTRGVLSLLPAPSCSFSMCTVRARTSGQRAVRAAPHENLSLVHAQPFLLFFFVFP